MQEISTPLMKLLWLCTTCISWFAASASTQSKVTDNPADQLVVALNDNRTASRLPSLYDNPGLACIALQYIKAFEGNCGAVGKAEKPADSEFAATFAPDCGVAISSLALITGRFLGCESKYISPAEAFSKILMKNNKSLEILNSKNHTEVGAAVSGSGGGPPYFWCILFSNGKPNSSFVLPDGVAKVSRPGCFSGANDDCSTANERIQFYPLLAAATAASFLLPFGLGM
ncbi:hypothetical protein Dimus_010586 [Dionaea muscipula]